MRKNPGTVLLELITKGPAVVAKVLGSKIEAPTKLPGDWRLTNDPGTSTTPAAVSGLNQDVVSTKPIFGVGPTGSEPDSANQRNGVALWRSASKIVANVWIFSRGATGSHQSCNVP